MVIKCINFAVMYKYEQRQNDVYVQFLDGHIKAFYESAYALLIVYAERLLGPSLAFMAEDCVQDAVFEAYGKREEMESAAHLKQFLYRCVHNNAVSALRKEQSRNRYFSVGSDDVEGDYSLELIRQETLERLSFALKQLPPELREMADMVFREELSGQEIADRLGISLSGVKKRKARLIKSLRPLVNDEGLLALACVLFI